MYIYYASNLFLQDFAIKTVKDTHEFWKALISKKTDAGELNWWVQSGFRVIIQIEGHIIPLSVWRVLKLFLLQ